MTQEETKKRVIHVASFSPADDRVATGSFEWSYELDDAKKQLAMWLVPERGIHNLSLVHMEVPAELDKDGITEWLDRNTHLIGPASRNETIDGDGEEIEEGDVALTSEARAAVEEVVETMVPVAIVEELRIVASFGMREYHAVAHSMDYPIERCDESWCKRATAALDNKPSNSGS